jgi:uncharacterized protein YdhG (YjbR/CyaY superfamily)
MALGRAVTIDEYMAGVPPKRQGRMEHLIGYVRAWYPGAMISIKNGMPTLETAGGWVAVANRKEYVTLYTCAPEHIAPYVEKHPAVKTGKACLNFRDADQIDFGALKAVVRSAMTAKK